MKNLKEFKDLISKYENITESEILRATSSLIEFNGNQVAYDLFGFGYAGTCSLCRAFSVVLG